MKKRARIHPLVAVAAIIIVGLIAITAKIYGHENPQLIQEMAIGIIALIVGIKVRVKLPLT